MENLKLSLFSALDRYYGIEDSPIDFFASSGDTVSLAKKYSDIEFTGVEGLDLIANTKEKELWFVSEESTFFSLPLFSFTFDPKRRVFIDKKEIYVQLRERKITIDQPITRWRDIAAMAILSSRYNFSFESVNINIADNTLSEKEQYLLLLMLFTSENPAAGLELLKKYNFIDEHWEDIAKLQSVGHSKEYHPEGNGWEHTVETFRHWKKPDLVLGISLLLHDIGKPLAAEHEGNTFHQHAQLGIYKAVQFLKNIGFSDTIIDEVKFLVKEHMLPEAISRIPFSAIEQQLNSPYFPRLLELFRCDLLSTFQGPEKYYAACKRYKQFLKQQKNPYRKKGMP